MNIVLASKSPRRRELMALITKQYISRDAEVDESSVKPFPALSAVKQLARLKAEAVRRLYPDDVVIGCDTVVANGETTLGKPHSREEAVQMLRSLSGKVHFVHTGVCILTPDSESAFTVTSEVTFFSLSEKEISDYADTDDPYDKAGAYGIQSGAARFVDKIDGDYFNIMGFPVSRVYRALSSLGVI